MTKFYFRSKPEIGYWVFYSRFWEKLLILNIINCHCHFPLLNNWTWRCSLVQKLAFCLTQTKGQRNFCIFCQLPECMVYHSQATLNSILFFLPFLQNLDVRRKKIFLGSIKLGEGQLCRNFATNKRPGQFFAFFCQLSRCMFHHSQATLNFIVFFLGSVHKLHVDKRRG